MRPPGAPRRTGDHDIDRASDMFGWCLLGLAGFVIVMALYYAITG